MNTSALVWQIVAYDAHLADAVARGEWGAVQSVVEAREQAAMELYRARRKNWVPALRPRFPERSVA